MLCILYCQRHLAGFAIEYNVFRRQTNIRFASKTPRFLHEARQRERHVTETLRTEVYPKNQQIRTRKQHTKQQHGLKKKSETEEPSNSKMNLISSCN